MESKSVVELKAEGETVIVSGNELASDRSLRLFFASVLGARRTEAGWMCPRRRLSTAELIVRINNFLEGKGFRVSRVGVADAAVQRDIERRRSYQRARDAGIQFEMVIRYLTLSDPRGLG